MSFNFRFASDNRRHLHELADNAANEQVPASAIAYVHEAIDLCPDGTILLVEAEGNKADAHALVAPGQNAAVIRLSVTITPIALIDPATPIPSPQETMKMMAAEAASSPPATVRGAREATITPGLKPS